MHVKSWKTVSTLVTMIIVAGCSESRVTTPMADGLAPTSIANAPAGMPVVEAGMNAGSSANLSSNDATADFVVTPSGGAFNVGNSVVYFPAGSICDPATSTYGASEWDKPCAAAKGSVKIHAVSHTSKIGVAIDFTPALRFVPSNSVSQWVWLYMSNPSVKGSSDFSHFNINYAANIKVNGVDESSFDSSLRTYVDAWKGLTIRRIKHFSGYQTSSGRSCNPDTDIADDCHWVED